jgi:Putative auto-transporter adhesin, head GIN domain
MDSHAVRGSGNVVAEDRAVSGFDRVTVSGSGELTVVQGSEEALTIEADDNLLPLIRSEVDNGRLWIGARNVNLRPTTTIRYRLKVKNLSELLLSGAVNANADSLKADRLILKISGAGNITVGHVETRTLSTEIAGEGNMSAAGQADRQVINISGSGSHHAAELKCARAEVHIGGSGHVSVWVTDSLLARIGGSGSVEYRGSPRVDAHVSGAGWVKPVGGGA